VQRSATQLGRTETIELEHGRLLPPTLQVHVARIPLLSSGAETTPRSSDVDVDCQARLLGGAKVEVVALAQTAASLSADDYDERITKRMSEAGGVPAIISARAISLAVRSLGALVAPFPIPVLERLEHHYIGKYGLECCKRKLFRYRFVRSYTRHSGHGLARHALEHVDRPEGDLFPPLRRYALHDRRGDVPRACARQSCLNSDLG
jgi:hypothetical protein